MSAKKSPDSRPCFRAQVLRLAATQYFPALDEGVKELVDSLIRVCAGDQARARRIVDQALQNRTCPTPADFAAISSDIGRTAAPSAGCELCDGTGWRYVKRPAKDVITGEPYEAEGRERCGCALGKYLGKAS